MSSTLIFILSSTALIAVTVALKPIETMVFLVDAGGFVYQLFFSKKPADRREAALGCLMMLALCTAAAAVIAVILWLT